MKIFTNKETTKKIIIAILLVMTFNFVGPNISYAAKEEVGGALFKPIVHLLAFLADMGIELAQEFLWDGSNINEDNNYEVYIRTSNNIYRKNSSD